MASSSVQRSSHPPDDGSILWRLPQELVMQIWQQMGSGRRKRLAHTSKKWRKWTLRNAPRIQGNRASIAGPEGDLVLRGRSDVDLQLALDTTADDDEALLASAIQRDVASGALWTSVVTLRLVCLRVPIPPVLVPRLHTFVMDVPLAVDSSVLAGIGGLHSLEELRVYSVRLTAGKAGAGPVPCDLTSCVRLRRVVLDTLEAREMFVLPSTVADIALSRFSHLKNHVERHGGTDNLRALTTVRLINTVVLHGMLPLLRGLPSLRYLSVRRFSRSIASVAAPVPWRLLTLQGLRYDVWGGGAARCIDASAIVCGGVQLRMDAAVRVDGFDEVRANMRSVVDIAHLPDRALHVSNAPHRPTTLSFDAGLATSDKDVSWALSTLARKLAPAVQRGASGWEVHVLNAAHVGALTLASASALESVIGRPVSWDAASCTLTVFDILPHPPGPASLVVDGSGLEDPELAAAIETAGSTSTDVHLVHASIGWLSADAAARMRIARSSTARISWDPLSCVQHALRPSETLESATAESAAADDDSLCGDTDMWAFGDDD